MMASSVNIKQPLLVGLDHFESRPGGLGRAFDSICQQFKNDGQPFNRIEIGLPFLGTVINPFDPTLHRIFWLLKSALKVRRDTSVIYSHFALHGLIISLVVHAPVISFFHGPWAQESLISSGSKLKWFKLQRFIEKLVYSKSRYIHCASESFKEILISEFEIEERKIVVVPLGVDLDRFVVREKKIARGMLGLAESDLIFVSVRRLTNRMGVADLIEGFSNFFSESSKGKLFIIGQGAQKDDYERQIESLGLSNCVKILGAISDSELPLWYAAADASVVPSRDLEGFGLVALESLACGTPVLASRCGGLEEIIETWNNDFLFDPSHPEQISTKLLAFSRGKLSESSGNCREYASSYTWGRSFASIKSSLEKTRILFLSSEDLISGAELSLFELAKNLSGRIDSEVLIGGVGPLYEKFQKLDIPSEMFPKLSLDFTRHSTKFHLIKTLLKVPAASYSVFRKIRSSDADVVFINTFKTLLISSLGVIFTEKRVIFWAHDSFDFKSRSQLGKRIFYWSIFKFSNIEIVCNSRFTARTLLENIGVSSAFVLYPIIRNPSVNHSGAPHDSIRIGICGRIAEWKGQLFAIQALEHLLSTSDHIVLEILGSPLFGDDEYFERIKNFIVDRDLSKKVILLPFQESPENIVASWDFAIHSSILPEPFGRTVVESLMVGVPVIVPDTGGPSEIVSDGENGLTYKIADSQDLYLKVCQLVENPLLVNELQLNSKTIYSSFNSKMQVESFESWLGVFTK